MSIPFVHEIEFEYGVVDQVTPLIRRVVCNNPGGFTFHGTGTYIIGRGDVAVIDPGPLDDAHIAALEKAVEGEGCDRASIALPPVQERLLRAVVSLWFHLTQDAGLC